MGKVIKFPQTTPCPNCKAKLRPATVTEIKCGLASEDQQMRQLFAHAVQGDVERKFAVEDDFTSMMEHDTPTASWVLICDSCGLKSAYLREEEPI